VAIVVERTTAKATVGSGTATVSFVGTPTIGNRIITPGEVWSSAGTGDPGISDQDSNSYTVHISQLDGGSEGRALVASAPITATRSGLQVSWTATGSDQTKTFSAMEVSGLDSSPVDITIGSNADATTPYELSTGTLAQADEIVVASFVFIGVADQFEGIDLTTWGGINPVTLWLEDGPGIVGEFGAAGYEIVASTTAVNVGFLNTVTASQPVAVAITTFKAGATATAAITGTATSTIDETDVVAGGETIIITLTDETWVPATVGPNIQHVGSRTAGFAGTLSAQTVSLGSLTGGDTGDTTPQAGDLVVVTYAIGSTVARTPTIATPGGGAAYTNANAILRQADNFDVSMLVAYKFMGGTPDTQVTLSEGVGGGTGSTADAGRYTIQVFRGVDTSTPLDVAVVTGGAANSSAVDPGAITPTTTGAIVVAMGAAASGTGSTMTSTLTDFVAGSTADTNDISIGAGYSTWAAGALNPAAFGNIPAGTTANSWVSLTIALRPSVTTPFADARQAIIDGLDSAQAEGTGWNAEVRDNLAVGTVVRTSDTVCTITLSAQAAYNITAQETITVTVPAAALTLGSPIVATPTFTVDPTGGGGAVSVTPTNATLVLASFAPTVSTPRLVTPGKATLVLATFAPTVSTPRLVTPGKGTLTLTTFAPTVLAPRLVTPGKGTLVLASFAPTVQIGVRVTPNIGTLTLSTFAPTVLTPRLVTPSTAALVLTGFAPTVTGGAGITLTPGTASLVLTSFAPTVLTPRLVTPSTASLVLATFAPTVSVAGTPILVTPLTGSLLLTTYPPTVAGTFVGGGGGSGPRHHGQQLIWFIRD
jgi:hypothetical protein